MMINLVITGLSETVGEQLGVKRVISDSKEKTSQDADGIKLLLQEMLARTMDKKNKEFVELAPFYMM
jgi:hypothetical protein